MKKELCAFENQARHCDIAEIAGLINACGTLFFGADGPSVSVRTENAAVAKKYFKLIKRVFKAKCELTVTRARNFRKNRIYRVATYSEGGADKLLMAVGLFENGQLKKRVNHTAIKSDCCKRAYLRGAFISGGSLVNPEKSYHLEFINSDGEVAAAVADMLRFLGLNGKITLRKNHSVVYLKEGENIVDLLNMLGAHISLMDLENVRIVKDMRNNVNRIVNCEAANIFKTANASARQTEDIKFIAETKGVDFLPKRLGEVAAARLKSPEASLKEIGAMLNPSIGKSGVNHRLRKISQIADSIRGRHLND